MKSVTALDSSSAPGWFKIELAALRIVIRLQSAALGLIHGILFAGQRLPKQPKNILIYRTGRLGDFVNAIPAMRVVRKTFPSARITLLTTTSTMKSMQAVTAQYADNFRQLPWIDLVTPSIVDEACVFSIREGFRGLWQVRKRVAGRRPDCAFLLSFAGEGFRGRAKKLVFLRLAGVRGPVYGWRMRWNWSLMPHIQYRADGPFEHQVAAAVEGVRECPLVVRIPERELTFELSIPGAARSWAADLLADRGWASKKIVAVVPGAPFEHKRWPTESFLRLCRTIHDRWDVGFVVLGIESDAGLAERLSEGLGGACVNLAGKTSVSEMAAIFEQSALCVSNDSGPAHLASAVSCPCVTVTSAMDFPGLWEPWNSRGGVVRHSIPCEFCRCAEKCPLGTNACIQGIPVSEVLEACSMVLGRAASSAASGLVHV